jgi:response regulator of citrate/malate metabolism
MIRVLVVDDDFRVSRIHSAYTNKVAGFEVIGQAFTAAEALRLTSELKPDLVLLDQFLPDRNGLDVVRDLLAHPDAPDIFVITAARDIGSVRTAMKLGAVGYLVKPFHFADFERRLLAYLDLRDRVESFEEKEADQNVVDNLFGTTQPTTKQGGGTLTLPKGHSTATFELVRATLLAAATDISAAELAEQAGISRPTAQRYLALLVQQGVASLELNYGTSGRPEHRYRCLT